MVGVVSLSMWWVWLAYLCDGFGYNEMFSFIFCVQLTDVYSSPQILPGLHHCGANLCPGVSF